MLALLLFFSATFAATHILMSHGEVRAGLVDKLGELGFRGAYSLVSFATFLPALYLYSKNKSMGPLLWEFSHWSLILVYLLMLLGLLLMTLMLANPSPTGFFPATMEPRGVLRITRHPMFMGISCIALAHMIANGYLGDVAFFGSLFVTGFVGAYHQDARKVKEKGKEYSIFQLQTSIVPFAALIRGRTKLKLSEFSIPLVIVAVVAFVALIFLHGRLFGEPPF